jgi:hypothetical protein
LEKDLPPNYAQLMLMVDGPADAFRGAILLIAQDYRREWRFYDADLFDDLDHMKRFVNDLLKSKYGLQEYMMLHCTVKISGWVSTLDPLSN